MEFSDERGKEGLGLLRHRERIDLVWRFTMLGTLMPARQNRALTLFWMGMSANFYAKPPGDTKDLQALCNHILKQ